MKTLDKMSCPTLKIHRAFLEFRGLTPCLMVCMISLSSLAAESASTASGDVSTTDSCVCDQDQKHPAATEDSSENFTTKTTHIEIDSLGRFLKIEVSGPEPSPSPKRPPEADQSKVEQSHILNWFGILRLEKYGKSTSTQCGGPRTLRFGFLEIPFFQSIKTDEQGSLYHRNQEYTNWYLFAFFDGVVEKQDKPNAMGGNTSYARVAFIDTPVFSFFKMIFEAPEKVYWEVLDLPLSSTLSHESDHDKSIWKVVNVPLFWLFRSERHHKLTRINIVDGPLVALYKQEQSQCPGKPRETEWKFGDVPLVSVARGRHDDSGDNSHTGLIETFKLGNGPLAALYSYDTQDKPSESNAPGDFAGHQILRLPLIGPVLGAWSDSEGVHASILPNLFYSSKNRPKAFSWF